MINTEILVYMGDNQLTFSNSGVLFSPLSKFTSLWEWKK